MSRNSLSRTVGGRTLVSAVMVGWLLSAAASAQAPPSRIELLSAASVTYRNLPWSRVERSDPEALDRLVVILDGVPVFDRGLIDRRSASETRRPDGTSTLTEAGVVETAAVAQDAATAAVVHWEYRLTRELDDRGRVVPDSENLEESDATLYWVDLEHPMGRWKVELEPGSRVVRLFAVDGGRGIVALVRHAVEAEFQVFGPDRTMVVAVGDLLPTIGEFRTTPSGTHIAADLSHPSRRAMPQRSIVVVDLVEGRHWMYRWSYGEEREPISWDLDSDGVLIVRTVAREYHYDAAGRPLGSWKHGKVKRKKKRS